MLRLYVGITLIKPKRQFLTSMSNYLRPAELENRMLAVGLPI